MRRVWIGLCWIIIALPGCKDKDGVPFGVMGKDKMQLVLWNILQVNALTIQLRQKDPVIENAKLQKQVFDLYNISREEFYKSYSWYKEHPVVMEAMLDSMIVKQEAEKRKENIPPPPPNIYSQLKRFIPPPKQAVPQAKQPVSNKQHGLNPAQHRRRKKKTKHSSSTNTAIPQAKQPIINK